MQKSIKSKEIKLTEQLIDQVLPFGTEDAELASEVFNRSGRRRGSLMDCMVAACALRRDVPLATANPSDFKRMEASGLRVVVA